MGASILTADAVTAPLCSHIQVFSSHARQAITVMRPKALALMRGQGYACRQRDGTARSGWQRLRRFRMIPTFRIPSRVAANSPVCIAAGNAHGRPADLGTRSEKR